MAGELELRSKRELIERFIEEDLPKVAEAAEIPETFEAFWEVERAAAFERLVREEQLDADRQRMVIERSVYTGKQPRPDPDFVELIERPMKLADRAPTRTRVLERVVDYVQTVVAGIEAPAWHYGAW